MSVGYGVGMLLGVFTLGSAQVLGGFFFCLCCVCFHPRTWCLISDRFGRVCLLFLILCKLP